MAPAVESGRDHLCYDLTISQTKSMSTIFAVSVLQRVMNETGDRDTQNLLFFI